ncbi:MAG: ABC transporter ATP-binding protein, partial [Oscillospiraceae bacterium]
MNGSICFENIHFAYGDEQVLNGVTAAIEEKGIHSLFGPNGSGKTTLLKCLAGLLRPQRGKILVCGQDMCHQSAKQISRKIAYVPQEYSLSFPFSVFEVVLMGRTPHLGGLGGGPSGHDRDETKLALESVGISDLSKKPFTELSGGQRQLALVARALAQDTPIIILDEPTSALDFKNQLLVWNTLRALKEKGKTIIVCTHDPNHVLWFSDTVTVLQNGNIVGQGKAEKLITNRLLSELY